MADTKTCSNCGSHRAFSTSLTKTDQGKIKQAKSDMDLVKLLTAAQRTQPFAAGILTSLAALDRFGILKFYFCPTCKHFQR
jgi:hypothetical protein